MSLSVCLTVCHRLCTSQKLRDKTSPNFLYVLTVAVARYSLRYVMHFRFCGWRHIFILWTHFIIMYGNADQWVRPPAQGFLLVFYSNSPSAPFRGMWQTDRQTDGRMARSIGHCRRRQNEAVWRCRAMTDMNHTFCLSMSTCSRVSSSRSLSIICKWCSLACSSSALSRCTALWQTHIIQCYLLTYLLHGKPSECCVT